MRWDWHQRRFKSRLPAHWKGLAPPKGTLRAEQELDQLEADVKAEFRRIGEMLPYAMPGIILIVMTLVIVASIKV